MPRKNYTPEQIIRKLREAEVSIAEGMPAQQTTGGPFYPLARRWFAIADM